MTPTIEPLGPRICPAATIVGEPTIAVADHVYTLHVVDNDTVAIDRSVAGEAIGTTELDVPAETLTVQIVAQHIDPATVDAPALHFLWSWTDAAGHTQIFDRLSIDYGASFAAAMLAMDIAPAPEGEPMLAMASLPPDPLSPSTATVQPVPEQLAMPREVVEPVHPDDLPADAALMLVADTFDAGLALAAMQRMGGGL